MDEQERDDRLREIASRFGWFPPPALLTAGRPPFDITKPNLHDTKAEFLEETRAVDDALEHTSALIQFIMTKYSDDDPGYDVAQTDLMARRTSSARVKANRSYSVEDAADAVGVTQQTVRAWINCGLPAMTAKRPTLILGWALKEFIIRAQQQRKKPLGPGEFFCFRCKQGRRAALGLIDYHSKSPTYGRLQAICEVCEGSLSLNVSTANLSEWRAHYP